MRRDCRGLPVKEKRLSENRGGFVGRRNDCRGIVVPSGEGSAIAEVSLWLQGKPILRVKRCGRRDRQKICVRDSSSDFDARQIHPSMVDRTRPSANSWRTADSRHRTPGAQGAGRRCSRLRLLNRRPRRRLNLSACHDRLRRRDPCLACSQRTARGSCDLPPSCLGLVAFDDLSLQYFEPQCLLEVFEVADTLLDPTLLS
jgi:hypothetical protein